MTKGKVILVPFPFDDFSGIKVRPAICLTNETGFYNHVVIAFVSSQIPASLELTDILLEKNSKDFKSTGLAVDSVVKLHKIITIPKHLIKRQLGVVSTMQQTEIDKKLKVLFAL